MLAHDARARDAIADAIRGAADEVVTRHIHRLTQEPQITSKIADRIEQDLGRLQVFGYHISVIATDVPDRGPGSLEKRTGVDLFMGIRVRSEDYATDISKGLLIQSKLAKEPIGSSENERLREQCEKMVYRSRKGAYVWLYTPTGVRSVPASELGNYPHAPIEDFASRNVAEQFRDVLDCVAGDETLANADIFEDDQALSLWMQEMGARRAVAVDVVGPPIFL